jgi:hypothetical protein
VHREFGEIASGVGYRLADWSLQDDTGDRKQIEFQVTKLNPKPDQYVVEGEEVLFDLQSGGTGQRTIYIDANASNVNLRTLHDTLYPAPTAEDVGVVSVLCIIQSGATVSSSNTSLPAFDVGAWPVGLEIILEVQGRIAGRDGVGGKGGNGGGPTSAGGNGTAGSPGGTALYTRKAIELRVSTGQIFGGRGGGGGAGGGAGATGTVGNQQGRACGGGGGGGGSRSTVGARGLGGNSGGGKAADNGTAGGVPTGGNGGEGSEVFGVYFLARGGDGGKGGNAGADYGQAGTAGQDGGDSQYGTGFGEAKYKDGGNGGSGGAGGRSIDGASFITVEEGPGDIRGAQIN